MGGGLALQLAIHEPRLAACVVVYGPLPEARKFKQGLRRERAIVDLKAAYDLVPSPIRSNPTIHERRLSPDDASDHEARREILQLSRWRVRMPPSVLSAFPPDALRRMTPCGLPRGPSMRHPAVPNARVLRAVVLHLAETSQRTRRMRAQDADTDVTTCDVYISICSMNIQYVPTTAPWPFYIRYRR